jgi:glucose-1-phosphate thymidylyltransferase
MPVYDKLMVYYPLTKLMLADIRDMLFIGIPRGTPRFIELLGDCSYWDINIEYADQPIPSDV